MADASTPSRYADHEDHFRDHFRKHYKDSGSHAYSDYESGYRTGFRAGTSDDYDGRGFDEAESEMRRRHEKKHGEGTWSRVKAAARHAFERGRSHRRSSTHSGTRSSETHAGTRGPSGSGATASGDPGSVMRGDDDRRDT